MSKAYLEPHEEAEVNRLHRILNGGATKGEARLIAAAPDLLAALDALINGPGDGFGHNGRAEVATARVAIAKATGQEG